MVVPDLTGKPVRVFPSEAKKGVVVFFVLAECPIANAFAPEMTRIANAYGKRGWKFYLAYTEQPAASHHRDFGFTFPGLVDRTGDLRRFAGATVSPEAAVFSPMGGILYRGRIDDGYYGLSQKRAVRVHDVRLALDALSSGKRAPAGRTQAIGCVLPK